MQWLWVKNFVQVKGETICKGSGGEPRVGETMWRGYVCTMSNLSNIELVKLFPQAINGVYQEVESVMQRLWVKKKKIPSR